MARHFPALLGGALMAAEIAPLWSYAGVTFEAAVLSIGERGLDRLDHHYNVDLHPGQHITWQEIGGQLYRIPCEIFESVHHEPCFFFRTIIKVKG